MKSYSVRPGHENELIVEVDPNNGSANLVYNIQRAGERWRLFAVPRDPVLPYIIIATFQTRAQAIKAAVNDASAMVGGTF